MSKVIMMCGVCGSGKTTYAKQKEKEEYIRLSIDEEMWNIYGQKGIDYPEEQYDELSDKVEHILRQTMTSLIKDEKILLLTLAFGIRIIEIFTKI